MVTNICLKQNGRAVAVIPLFPALPVNISTTCKNCIKAFTVLHFSQPKSVKNDKISPCFTLVCYLWMTLCQSPTKVIEHNDMNLNNYTIKAQESIQAAQQVAFNAGNANIETAHLLKALLDDDDSPVEYLLKKNNVNVQYVENRLNESHQPPAKNRRRTTGAKHQPRFE